MSAEIIPFYNDKRKPQRLAMYRGESATIIILPVTRIRDVPEAPSPYGLSPRAERQRLRRKAQRAGPNTRN